MKCKFGSLELVSKISGHKTVEYGYDADGRICIKESIQSIMGVKQNSDLIPFEDCSFITISKEDARKIVKVITSIIDGKQPTSKDLDQYKQLIDALKTNIGDL